MFRATLKDVKILKDSIDAIAQIIDEAVFKFKPQGIELLAADRAKVAAIDFKLPKDAFEEYKCEKEIGVGLNLANLQAILKRTVNADELEIKLNEKENKLEFIAKGKSIRSFSIPILDLSEEELPPIDKLQFSAKAEVDIDIVKQGIDDANTIADSVVLQTTKNEFKMLAEGDSSRVELKIDKEIDSSLEVEGEARARYPIDYLKKIMKAASLVDRVTIRLGTDYPMKIEFPSEKVYLAMVLAPRVEE
jgi:proliferating cell nuclear antigen